MDKTAIKNYAVTARRKLIEAVRLKAQQLYIFEDSKNKISHDEAILRLRSDGIHLSPEQVKARLRLYDELLYEDIPYKKDQYARVMEEVAYTWFNRLIALRFMEVNDYLPSGIRILSSLDKGRIEPDSMREAERLDFVDQKKVSELRSDLSMITMHSWMFLSSYEKFREKLIGSKDIVNMAHLGARAFEEIGGEVVQTTAFVMRRSNICDYLATYIRLVDYAGQQTKEDAFLADNNRHTAKKENFEKIPGWPVAYWISNCVFQSFANKKLADIAKPRQGLATTNNNLFLRLWHEIDGHNFDKKSVNSKDALSRDKKWFPLNKGGSFRRWYGNNEYVVNYKNNGAEICSYIDNTPGVKVKSNGRVINRDLYFHEGMTWSSIASGLFAMRYVPHGFIFETKGSMCFSDMSILHYLLALLNTKPTQLFLSILSPTLDYHEGPVGKIPVIIDSSCSQRVQSIVGENIVVSVTDWDSFETSWDFKCHPLVYLNPLSPQQIAEEQKSNTSVYISINDVYQSWERHTEKQFALLKANEEELNRIFIDIYGLQDELTPEAADKDVTIRKADLGRDIRSFLSYAVGCMFGRYSLDEPGLVYAGGQFDMSRYKTFLPEDDNIIPIGSADYFDDDIVVRFTEFVRKVYGDATLNENLNFIADALYPTGNGSAKDKIRRYFLNDFYKDHVRIYQKRPIYWLLDSGKKDGFKALIYLHRYDKYTVARARTDYLHPLQRKYEAEIKRLEMMSGSTEKASEKAAYRKEIDVLQNKIEECRIYDQVVAHIAHQQIELDLDDGVKVNYEKFQGVEVPKDNGKFEKMDLLGKI